MRNLYYEQLEKESGPTKFELTQRTPEETKAYVEGFNNAYKQFLEYLRKPPLRKAVDQMKVLVAAVNAAAMHFSEEKLNEYGKPISEMERRYKKLMETGHIDPD